MPPCRNSWRVVGVADSAASRALSPAPFSHDRSCCADPKARRNPPARSISGTGTGTGTRGRQAEPLPPGPGVRRLRGPRDGEADIEQQIRTGQRAVRQSDQGAVACVSVQQRQVARDGRAEQRARDERRRRRVMQSDSLFGRLPNEGPRRVGRRHWLVATLLHTVPGFEIVVRTRCANGRFLWARLLSSPRSNGGLPTNGADQARRR